MKLGASFLVGAAVLCLAACQGMGSKAPERDIDAALQRAQAQALAASGQEALAAVLPLERAYSAKPGPATALPLSAGLRRAGYANRAAVVIAPYAQKAGAAPALKVEFAAVQLEIGRYLAAEESAVAAIKSDPHGAYAAYHLLGLALEAQGRHPEAERAFVKAVNLWQGDVSIPLNNLGLNLLAQKRLKEAESALSKAAAMAPGRPEIQRNLSIVRSLRRQA
jgi:Flp pilus assembly protein TadD